MNILVAPNAFKGTIKAEDAAALIAGALEEKYPDLNIMQCPIADGGDGTCYLLGRALGLEPQFMYALNAIGKPVQGYYFLTKNHTTAYLDVSTVSGIKDLHEVEKQADLAQTYGTGEMILNAVQKGAKHIVLGLGGSASIDLATGILGALGFVFLDQMGRQIPFFSADFIQKVRHIQRPIQKQDLHFTCLCDVDNFFFGEYGAIPVFGPQKGLDSENSALFEKDCGRLLELYASKSGKEIEDSSGFGAAGGIAFGLSYFYPLEIQMGAKWFFESIGMEEKVAWADCIITGEGKYDSQSAGGKGSYELLWLAKKAGKKCFLITSGNEANKSDFDHVGLLPDLDFSNERYKSIAAQNLKEVVKGLPLSTSP